MFSRRRIEPVLQAEAAECGIACVAMLCRYYEHSVGLSELRRRFPVSLKGTSLRAIMMICDKLGFATRAVRCEMAELSRLELPCVLHWDLDHFVVLRKVSGKDVTINDPARGEVKLSLEEVSRHFTGVALELAPAPAFQRRKTAERVELFDLWTRMSGLKPILAQVFLLTLLLQAFAMVMPLANQMVIDDVIGRGDQDLLVVIIAGFFLIAIVQTAIEFLRGMVQLHAGQKLSLQLTGNLLKHLLRLPTDFFERRHVGDILSRFGSLGPVQSFLTGGVVGVVLDCIMVVPAGIIMFLYSPALSAVVIGGLLVVLAVQFATFERNRRYADEVIGLSARTESIFLETIRAIRPIKLSGREVERHAIWQNAMTDQQNSSFRQAVFNLSGGSAYNLLMVGQGLLMLYLGAREIIAGNMTLGMLIAFQSYATQFSGRTRSLIGQVFTFRMLGLHLERLGDIVHAGTEDGGTEQRLPKPLEGRIELRNVGFRYAPQDGWVLKDIDLTIEAGDRVALIGPSGGGKSTLIKVIMALYSPESGDILIDGTPLRSFGISAFRDQIGVVMQDDQLLSGTIADNVAFFDTEIDMDRVEAVCRIAMIHDEIVRLPMGYHSLTGDMGSILSGGQKQRVLLARALYRNPKVLFMDEGTANLDPALEAGILANLDALPITQIMVAHRSAAIRFATKIYRVGETGLVSVPHTDAATVEVSSDAV